MTSTSLIDAIQHDARPLVESLYGELRTNLGTSHYHRLSNEELFRRGQAVYQHLCDWLSKRDDGAIQSAGEELGRKRFSEGIPLGQVVLALVLEEKHLWSFLDSEEGPHGDEKLRLEVAEFFARTIYSTALGYEDALAQNNRKARVTLIPAKPPAAPIEPESSAGVSPGTGAGTSDIADDNHDMAASRGGDVPELGG